MPAGLARELFDHSAPSFEHDLVGALRYQGPALLYRAVRDVVGEAAGGFDILDGGCGTGLCGKVFRPMARRLVGVDISAEMIKLASEKGLYDELIQGELSDALARRVGAFDIVLAGDVLIYLGTPDPIMAAARTALKPDGSGFDLARTGRYRHSDTCIEDAAAKAGLDIAHVHRAALRFELDEAVEASVFVLSRT